MPILLLISILLLIPILLPIPPSSRQALITATLLLILAVDWERIKKFRSILQAEYIEIYSCYKKWWFQIGLVIEGDNIGVYKAYIKDANSLKDLTLSPLFSKSNGLNLGPIFSFLPILIIVEEFLITRVYIYLQVVYIRGQ